MRMGLGKEEWGIVDKASARGGNPSKEGDNDAAEAKPWQGKGGVVLLRQWGKGWG